MEVLFVLVALVFFTIFKGVRLVPQGYKWVVQRLGKYHQTLEPGLNFIFPLLIPSLIKSPPKTSCWTFLAKRSLPVITW